MGGYNSDLSEIYNNGCIKFDIDISKTSDNNLCKKYSEMKARASARETDCADNSTHEPSIIVRNKTRCGKIALL